jgi:hypothetical protein
MVSPYHVGDVGVCPIDGDTGGASACSPPVKKNAACPPTEQSDNLQTLAWAGVPLSVCEIRRLFWWLVLVTQQRVAHLLAWSTWRRWHQGIAKYWHYKRRAGP